MSELARLWHVTVTVSGEAVEPLIVRKALGRLCHQRPFLHSLRYAAGRAEIKYWDEAQTLLDASSLALRVWNEHRETAGLPAWEVVGLEVVERQVFLARGPDPEPLASMVDLQDVTPLPF